MKRLIMFSLLFLFIAGVHCQTITQATFTTTGQRLAGSGLNLNFSLGELSIQNLKSSFVGITTGLFGKEEEGVFQTLPVKLLDFRLVVNATSVNLHWTVDQEVNTAYYEVLKSTNGADFSSIGKVLATGTATTNRQYQLTDLAFAGKSFYKLKMADANGRFAFSNTLMALHKTAVGDFAVHPNPVVNQANVSVAVGVGTAATLSIHNAAGAVVWSRTYTLVRGQNVLSIPTADLSQGVYFFTVNGKDLNISKQVVKL